MNGVIIFAKYPEKGKVKTRLGDTLGDGFASGFYRYMAEYIFNVCRSLPKEDYDVHLFFYDLVNKRKFEEWVPSDFALHLQRGNDLGERMKDAFGALFKKRYKKVIIIGTDCPQINVNILTAAFDELSGSDLVIGPSSDGGYYLLGMKEFYTFLFDNIRWSSREVFSRTEIIAKEKKLSVSVLPVLIDIDTEDDLRNWLMTFNK